MMKLVSALAATGLTIAPVSATMATPVQDVVAQLFEKADELFADKGLTPTGWQQQGKLKNGAESTLTVSLKGDKTFAFVGMCDGDCSNVDMYVSDSKGKLVDSDEEDDDFPIVVVNGGGTYKVRVVMKACKSECGFGVKTYQN
jgi:hypothetical protein